MVRRPRERFRRAGEHNGGSEGNGAVNGDEHSRRRLARSGTDRGKIIEAFMELLGEWPIERIDLPDIAARAGVSIADMRGEFGSKLAILAASFKEIDREVLAADRSDIAEEPPRERLFEVLMLRLEALEPYREAIRSLLRSSRTNPALVCALNSLSVSSQQWMLAAADISSVGPLGLIRAQGLAIAFARVLGVFVDDDDPGHARTMAALDRALSQGQRWMNTLDGMCRFVPRCGPRRRTQPNPRDEDAAEPVAL